MGMNIAEDMNDVLAVALGADITHLGHDAPRVEGKLAGAGGAQDIE